MHNVWGISRVSWGDGARDTIYVEVIKMDGNGRSGDKDLPGGGL